MLQSSRRQIHNYVHAVGLIHSVLERGSSFNFDSNYRRAGGGREKLTLEINHEIGRLVVSKRRGVERGAIYIFVGAINSAARKVN